MPQSIATPASRCDVGSIVPTAILARGEVFCCALQLACLTNANTVRASKLHWITQTHFASAVIATLVPSLAGLGPQAGNPSRHGFDAPI
jgi:hypothetical protein